MKPASPKTEVSTLLPLPVRRWIAARLAGTSHAEPVQMKEAAILKVDRIGDFVLALGALRLLVRHYGEDRCVLLVSDKVEKLAAAEFPRTERLVLPDDSNSVLRVWWPLRRRHGPYLDRTGFKTLVNLRHWPTPYHRLILSWIKTRQIHSLSSTPMRGENPLATARALAPDYPPVSVGLLSRELLGHQRVVSAALNRPVTVAEIWPRFESIKPEVGDYLLVCPFGSASIRDYPEAQLASALHESLTHTDCRVVFSGTTSQRPALERLAARVGAPRTELRTDDTVVGFVQRVADARAVFTAESAAAHISTALDKPAVILLGGGHAGMFGPWGEGRRQYWLTNPLSCFGCDWRCIHPEALCLTQIPSARIASALRAALSAG
ncbi:MAG: hypothetical protein NTV51_25650 [Verrucomicrobia bacterium]|nr:hypothetical protein [Verrucomicrobiota bacterium]